VVIAVVLTRKEDGTVTSGNTTIATDSPGTSPTTLPGTTTASTEPQTTTQGPPAFTPLNGMDSECDIQAQPYVCITDIQVDPNESDIVVTFEGQGFTPTLGEGGATSDGEQHIHFFLDTVNQENAGTQGNGSGAWHIWDDRQPFAFDYSEKGTEGYTTAKVADEGGGLATAICALVADAGHATTADTGNCFPLPPEALTG
jgi:hypothetical protein